jgi:glutathione-regulated potassium-efflux system ancillary protein KefC
MEQVWLVAALWLGLALLAAFISTWLRISTSLCEIVIGAVAAVALRSFFASDVLQPSAPWVAFLAGAGAMLLTFLAGTELDPELLRSKWKEAAFVGLVGFLAAFLGIAAVARWLLGWTAAESLIAGIVLSTGSVSLVYTIMRERGISQTSLAKGILAASYLNNLLTAIALGLMYAPSSRRTLVFAGVSVLIFLLLPFLTARFLGRLRGRVSEPDVRYLLFLLFGMGGLSLWAGGEVILPAYVMGMVLAGLVGKNDALIRHLRILTFGLLTPFYFLRAGALTSIPAISANPLLVLILLPAKVGAKTAALVPGLRFFSHGSRDAVYYSLMMSSGLGLGTIAATFALNHGILDQAKYSHLVAAVIASAVLPTALANVCFTPKQFLEKVKSSRKYYVLRPKRVATWRT